MECGVFPAQLKQARVLPLLKKPTLDPDDATYYRPISISAVTVSQPVLHCIYCSQLVQVIPVRPDATLHLRRRADILLRSRLQRPTRFRSGPTLLHLIHGGPR